MQSETRQAPRLQVKLWWNSSWALLYQEHRCGGVNGLTHVPEAATAEFLSLANVNVARGDNVVLHDINLRIASGEHVAILGPNGCGKSTLIKTMTCECYPLALEETRVRIFGRQRGDLTELKKRLGVVSAELPGRQTLKTSGRDAVLTGFFSSS